MKSEKKVLTINCKKAEVNVVSKEDTQNMKYNDYVRLMHRLACLDEKICELSFILFYMKSTSI